MRCAFPGNQVRHLKICAVTDVIAFSRGLFINYGNEKVLELIQASGSHPSAGVTWKLVKIEKLRA